MRTFLFLAMSGLSLLLHADIRSLQSGYDYLNQLRSYAGMIPLTSNFHLHTAAKNHDNFMIQNNVFGHYESQGMAGFTGVRPSDRAVYAGYPSRLVSENIAAGDKDIEKAIDGLFSAIYHRLGFLDFTIDEVGASYDRSQNYYYKSVSTFDMGTKGVAKLCEDEAFSGYGSYTYNICADKDKKISYEKFQDTLYQVAISNPKVVLWPPKGYMDTPPAFYEESPDPLPECSVSGYPVSVSFNPLMISGEPKMDDFYLLDENGQRVEMIKTMTHQSDPSGHFSIYDFAIFPKKRLEWGKRYHAVFSYTRSGSSNTLEWDFATRSLPGAYYKIEQTDVTLPVRSGRTYYLYVEPKDCNDKISRWSYSYDYGVSESIEAYDQNTIEVNIQSSELGKEVRLQAAGRNIVLKVADYDEAIYPHMSQVESSSSMQTSCPSGSIYVDGVCIMEASNSSSSSIQKSCPSGYVYNPDLEYCVAAATSDTSASFDSSEMEYCISHGGEWIDGVCLSGVESSSSSSQSMEEKCTAIGGTIEDGICVVREEDFERERMRCENRGGEWKNDLCYASSEPKLFTTPATRIVSILSSAPQSITGYFIHYNDPQTTGTARVFNWIYINKKLSFIIKLQGMKPDGTFSWSENLAKYFDHVEKIGDTVHFDRK